MKMTLSSSDKMDLFQRFKDKGIDKLRELSVTFKANRNYGKAQLADLLILIKSQDIDGLKALIKELSRSGAYMESIYADSLLKEKLKIKLEEPERAKDQKLKAELEKIPKNKNSLSDSSLDLSEKVYQATANLKEILPKYVKQIQGEPHRRWFENDYFDLLVWQDNNREIVGFQLCYDKIFNQHALTWRKGSGYYHNKVDDGENKPGKYKSAPILIADGIFDHEAVAEQFKTSSKNIEKKVSAFVYKKLKNYRI